MLATTKQCLAYLQLKSLPAEIGELTDLTQLCVRAGDRGNRYCEDRLTRFKKIVGSWWLPAVARNAPYRTFARCCPNGVNDVTIQDFEEDVRHVELVSFMSEADAGNEKTNS